MTDNGLPPRCHRNNCTIEDYHWHGEDPGGVVRGTRGVTKTTTTVTVGDAEATKEGMISAMWIFAAVIAFISIVVRIWTGDQPVYTKLAMTSLIPLGIILVMRLDLWLRRKGRR